MGQLMNPISLRISVNRLWNFSWYILGKYEFGYLFLHELNIQYFLKKFFNLKIFPKRGYLYSNVKILYYSKFIDLKIYLHKTILNLKFKKLRFKSLIDYIIKYFYKNIFYNIIIKLKNLFRFYFYVFNYFFKFLKTFKNLKIKKNFIVILLNIKIKQLIFYKFFNFVNFFLLFRYNNKKEKRVIYLNENRKNFNIFIVKIFFLFLKFKFWRKISFLIKFFLRKFIKNFIYVRICKINYLGISINIIGNFLIKRLKQRFKILELINPIMRNLKKNRNILGFKFSFCGRFSREEMATTEIFSHAAVPLNTLNLFIEYKLIGVILKDSYCGIKIWINRKKERFQDLYFYSRNIIWNFLD